MKFLIPFFAFVFFTAIITFAASLHHSSVIVSAPACDSPSQDSIRAAKYRRRADSMRMADSVYTAERRRMYGLDPLPAKQDTMRVMQNRWRADSIHAADSMAHKNDPKRKKKKR